MSDVFLRAQWRHLVVLNFEIDPTILTPLIPRGVEIDDFNGYNVSRRGRTIEYHVEHPRWTASSARAELEIDAETIYGSELGGASRHGPTAVFIADGSEVCVHRGYDALKVDHGPRVLRISNSPCPATL